MKQNMSLTKALSEIKLIDSKITKKIERSAFIDLRQGEDIKGDTLLTHRPIDKFKEEAKASFQSIEDLFSNRKKIKAALSQKNAETIITVNNENFSIASAIEYKKSIKGKEQLLAAMKYQYSCVLQRLEKFNQEVKAKAHEKAITFLGGNPDVNAEKYKSLFNEKVTELGCYKKIDPLDLKMKIEKLEDSIVQFQANIDCELSQINSLTEIEVDLD